LSVTTLEEVFIKVATSKEEDENKKTIGRLASRYLPSVHDCSLAIYLLLERLIHTPVVPAFSRLSSLEQDKKNDRAPSLVDNNAGEDSDKSEQYLDADSNNQSFGRHFAALFMKRFHVAKRDRRAICCTLILPIVLVRPFSLPSHFSAFWFRAVFHFMNWRD
jgi:hypothetical protein